MAAPASSSGSCLISARASGFRGGSVTRRPRSASADAPSSSGSVVPGDPDRLAVRPVEQAESGADLDGQLVGILGGDSATQLESPLVEADQVGRATCPVRPHGAPCPRPAAQEVRQVVARRRHGTRLEARLLEQSQRALDRPAFACCDQHAQRALRLARQGDEIKADVLGRERDVALQLEGHHLRELGATRWRQLQRLHGDSGRASPMRSRRTLSCRDSSSLLSRAPGTSSRLEREAMHRTAPP